MTLKNLSFFVLLGLLFSCKEKNLFEKIESSHSNITFSNVLVESDTLNILDFEYFYNGSGVGIADFNNDGLQDIFFSGNQVANKMYINKGDFKFEDISELAGIEGQERWSAGVITVDINADGLMDVYVAATVKGTAEERQNLLFVNQGLTDGVPIFKELGEEYGVNDSGHTENAAFFDYDNDGDLDLYILTNIADSNPNSFRKKVIDGSYPNTDRFYECTWSVELGHPVYKDISKQAGITIEGYGLGLNICDINRDGWKDIYVTNDYAADDLLYINMKDGTFQDMASDYFKHTSNSAMGNDVADINNDGYLDMVALDMLAKNNERKKVLAGPMNYQLFMFSNEFGYTYQYMRNTLQLNNGVNEFNKPMFSEISFLAGFAETDWSWTPSLADFDNDGYRDLIVTNGFPKDVTDRDFMAYRQQAEFLASRPYLLGQMPEVKISNYAFRNNGNLEFEDVTKEWGMEIPSFSNGAVYADLDNDGDLDYVVNNIDDEAFVFRNNLIENKEEDVRNYLRVKCIGDGLNINGIGAVVLLEFASGEKMIHENMPQRGYLSSVEPTLHFGLGDRKVVSLKVFWPNGKMQLINNPELNQVLEVNVVEASLSSDFSRVDKTNIYFEDISDSLNISYTHFETDFIDFNLQNLIPFKLSESGPGVSVGDINSDGLEDFFIGGSKGQSGVFMTQKANGEFNRTYLLDEIKVPTKLGEDLGSLFFDADGDGDLDLYICKGGTESAKYESSYQDQLFLNDGSGNFTLTTSSLPDFTISTSCVRGTDYDNDGDLDLFVAGRSVPSEYPKFETSKILRNDSRGGQVSFTDVTDEIAPGFNNVGLICDILLTDFDNDGQTDAVLIGEWSEIIFMKNENGKFSKAQNTGLEGLKGIWTSINGADFDQDGDIDYVVGNIGENSLMKGTEKEPTMIVAKDFDNNGNYDIIPFVYFNTESGERKLVPYNGRDDVNKQLNVIRTRFVSYKDFTLANMDNLLTAEEKKDAQVLTLNCSSSIYIENRGNGKFSYKKLPRRAQFSQVNGIQIQDFDQDGYEDIVLSGNNYGNEPIGGRYDASNGLFLKGDGHGNFEDKMNTGFYVAQNAKASAYMFDASGQMLLLASQNRGPLKVFKTEVERADIGITAKHKYLTYEFNGKTVKKEIYAGSSYLSQSSRNVSLPNGANNIKLYE
ncbi:VCBS repeat-containing protein [uncultured Arcticibacterium sp.]|uniref:VCBS repeat-containing protein n=1 Tax=uncultured Arcticibacterium sp. TaxID=2173042 RepID=UPI0030F8803E